MSARKRARVIEHDLLIPDQPEQRACLFPSLLSSWSVIPPELLHQITTFLLRSSATSFRDDCQLLCRMSSVCVDWRKCVYHESGSGYVDFWSCIGTVLVNRNRIPHDSVIVGGNRPVGIVMPNALHSLRCVRSVRIGGAAMSAASTTSPPLTLRDFDALLEPLQRFTHLTSLDINIQEPVATLSDVEQHEAEELLNISLSVIASRAHSQLTALSLHCIHQVRPRVDLLRRLCLSAQQLSLSAAELLLMAWGTDSLYTRVWKAPSVQSFTVLARAAPSGFFTNKLVRAAFAASLPSVTHLHVEGELDPLMMSSLMQKVGYRLVFLRSTTAALQQLPSSFATTCSALTSLCLLDSESCGLSVQVIDSVLACLVGCPTLTELSVIALNHSLWPGTAVHFFHLPQLRYLHIRTYRVLDYIDTLPEHHRYSMLSPNITHLALVLDKTQHPSLFDAINLHRMPLLTHCHVSCINPSATSTSQEERLVQQKWAIATSELSVRFVDAWCEYEEDVVRWRADRVWRRSVELPDEAEDYRPDSVETTMSD